MVWNMWKHLWLVLIKNGYLSLTLLHYNEEIKKQHFCTSEVEQWLDVLEFTEA